MKLGLIKPTYPNERRIALLPNDISPSFTNELVIESGFGATMHIADQEYREKGCRVRTRKVIFEECSAIFCLKLLQPEDYEFLRSDHLVIGWTHPTGSGTRFFNEVAKPRGVLIADLDNIYPTLYHKDRKFPIPWIPKNFIRENSFFAGFASVMHALLAFGIIPDSNWKVAVLSPGNVAQGALSAISKFSPEIRLYYRNTMHEFYQDLPKFDMIINGIEAEHDGEHVLTLQQLKLVKKGAFIIDSAADAGRAIEGTRYTRIDDPIYEKDGLFYYVVNNAPSLYFRNASRVISTTFSEWVYSVDAAKYYDLAGVKAPG